MWVQLPVPQKEEGEGGGREEGADGQTNERMNGDFASGQGEIG